jgi:hypothetical protein
MFAVTAHFRTVGAGTSAVMVGALQLDHSLAATGLTSLGAAGTAIPAAVVSSGFDSTPANRILGVSFNGGTSFAGTCALVEASWSNP